VRGYLGDGRRWLEEALAQGAAAPDEVRAKALTAAANLARFQGDLTTAKRFAEENLVVARRSGSAPALIHALIALGNVEAERQSHAAADRLVIDARRYAVSEGERWLEGQATLAGGGHALIRGDYDAAGRLLSAGLSLLGELGDWTGAMVALQSLGFAALHQRRIGDARAHLADSLQRAHEVGHRRATASCIEGIAAVLAHRMRILDAAGLLAAAEAIRTRTGASLAPFERPIHERTAALVREQLDRRLLDRALADGRLLTVDDAVDRTLGLAAAGVAGNG